MRRIAEMDGWRACAVASVLVAHFFGFPFINLGRLGVELFFVLSGRLMAEILFVNKSPIKSFYIGRLSRVYPALLVFAIGAAIFEYLAPDGYMNAALIASVLSFTINYTQFWIGHGETFGHIWSLCVEVHTYIVLGLIAAISRRWNISPVYLCVIVLAVCIIDGVICFSSGLDYYATYWRSDVRGGSILIGAISYLYWHRRGYESSTSLLPVGLLLLGVLLNLNVVPDPVKYSLGTGCLASALVLLDRAPAFMLRVFRNPWFARFGVISYSVYLWQQPFWRHTEHRSTRAIALIFALGVSVASYRYVEGPSRRAINRWLRHRRDDKGIAS